MIDCLKLRDYAYSSEQIFSVQGWACIGDAAMFPDPFYSPGIVLQGYENTIISQMIALDNKQQLTPERVTEFNQFVISIGEGDKHFIQSQYNYFHQMHIWVLRYLFGLGVSWGIIYPQMFNGIYLDAQKSETIRRLTGQYTALLINIERFFKDWAEKTQQTFSFNFINYMAIPFIKEIYERNTKSYTNFDDVVANYKYSLDKLEEFAQVIFLLAVNDTMPDKGAMFSNVSWLNAWAISLNPEMWQKRKLLSPRTPPRDLSQVQQQIHNLMT